MKINQEKTNIQVKQFFKVVVVGLIATIFDITMLNISVRLLKFPILLSNTLGVLIGITISYLLNSKWSFEQSFTRKRLIKFVIVNIGTIGLNDLAVVTLTNIADLQLNFSKVIAIAACFMFNFFLYKSWVFADSRKTQTKKVEFNL